jgi:putative drug exporter of the RND superfamily
MFTKIGRVVVHHPWLTIVAWAVIAAAVLVSAPGLKAANDQAEFLPSHYESVRASELAEKAFPDAQAPAAIMVFTRPDHSSLGTEDRAAVARVVADLGKREYADVRRIVTGPDQVAPNGKVMIAAVIPVSGSEAVLYGEHLMDSVKQIRADAKPLLDGSGVTMGITGETATALDQQEAAGDVDQMIMMATLVLIVVLLLLIFRSPLIALLPIATIAVVMMLSLGLIGAANEIFDLKADRTIQPLLIVVLFGVGTDYFLFLVFRYRERLRSHRQPKQALVEAVQRAGEAIFSAAGAVIVSFGALLLSTLGQLKTWGPALAIAVGVTLAASLTLVPAVMSLFGTKLFWPSRSWRRQPKEAVSGGLGRLVGHRPGAVAAVSAGLLVVLAVFAIGFKPSFDFSSSGPKDLESTRAMNDLQLGFPAGSTQPTDVLLSSRERLGTEQLASFGRELAKVDGVGQVSPPEVNPNGTVAHFSVLLKYSPASDQAIDLAGGPLRDAAHRAAPPGSEALVGGLSSVVADIQHAVGRDYRVVFPVAGLLIMLILALLLRSLVAPWYLMASVSLGFAAALGGAVLLFQHLRDQPGLIFQLPLMMYLFVVAIGTDYNILMVARLREEARAGHSPRQAAALAVRHAAPTIAAAGAILAGTFGVLLLAQDTALQQMGFSISFGILVAAFVMSILLTPALTALIGHRAWWPGHQDRPDRSPASGPRDLVESGSHR